MILFIPYLAHSTNKAIRAHHQERRRQVKAAAWACKAACKGVAPIVGQVDIVFRPRLGKGVPRRDTSNYSINVKHIEDGLVTAGLLPDDRGQYVRRVIMEPPEVDRKAATGTWVEIIPVEVKSERQASGKTAGTQVQQQSGEAAISNKCWCMACDARRAIVNGHEFGSVRMNLCPDCGNKRCPRATNHLHECTNSNEPGQPGSAYQ